MCAHCTAGRFRLRLLLMQETNTLATANSSDQALVDRIGYLCSLASDPIAVGRMTDTLRDVTSRWRPPAPMDTQDRTALSQLERDLKAYLMRDDPLRAFTPQTLEERLQAKNQINKDTSSLLYVLLVSVAAGAGSFAVPSRLSAEYRTLLTVPLFFLALHIGIAWFYLSALRNFNQTFRSAFTFFCVGLVLLSLGFSHYVLIQLFGWHDYPAFRYGGITILISICFVFFYLGLRLYAGLLHIKSWLMSLPLVASITAGLVALAVFVPHPPVPHETYYDISLACAALLPLFSALAAGLAHKIIRNVTPAYGRSMKWLYAYLLMVSIGSIPSTIALYWIGELYGSTLYTVIALCGIGPQLLLLYTGYSFKKETSK